MRDRIASEKRYAEFLDVYLGGFAQDVPIYLDLAAKHPGPILEIGCGTGRVLARLARAGHEVVGLDIHRPMLELARERLRPWRDLVRVAFHDLRREALTTRHHVALVTLHCFNAWIEIEEQRLFLRHLRRSIVAPGVVALDCFYPLAFARPELAGEWREIERSHGGRTARVRDRREMLTPLLERRTQVFRVDAGPETEYVTHRRYVTPGQLAALLEEAGFENVCWMAGYDAATLVPAEPDHAPAGPFLMLAEV
jgi:SAM-dependent methyltransferase